MTLGACPHQPEVQELLAAGHWPHACPPEIRAHVAACHSCSEQVLVDRAFQQARVATAALAQLPDPGAIWWRAQLRRRNAAIERVTRPLAGAYFFALALTVLAALAVLVRHAHWLIDLQQSISYAPHLQTLIPSAWLDSAWALPLLLPFLATLVLLGAVVVYLAAEKQ